MAAKVKRPVRTAALDAFGRPRVVHNAFDLEGARGPVRHELHAVIVEDRGIAGIDVAAAAIEGWTKIIGFELAVSREARDAFGLSILIRQPQIASKIDCQTVGARETLRVPGTHSSAAAAMTNG